MFCFRSQDHLNCTRALTGFPRFKQESALFTKDASSIFKALSSVVSSFSDEEKLSPARDALEKTHTPQKIATNPRQHLTVTVWFFLLLCLNHHSDGAQTFTSLNDRAQVFNSAVYKILRQALGGKLTSDDQFAIIALINEPSFQPADQEDEPPSRECRPPPPPHAPDFLRHFPLRVKFKRSSQPTASRSLQKVQTAGSRQTARTRQALRRRPGPKVTRFDKTPTPPTQVSHQLRLLEVL